jgi:hypothetical protein
MRAARVVGGGRFSAVCVQIAKHFSLDGWPRVSKNGTQAIDLFYVFSFIVNIITYCFGTGK